MTQALDVLIVGGGPAGLNAALMLGRCRRSVLVCDAGTPRNARSRGVSGFLTRDGIAVADMLSLAREQLTRYPSVRWRDGEVRSAKRMPNGFEVTFEDGRRATSRKLVLASGLGADIPDFPDAESFYGRGVYPCPYCDGWEHRDEPIAAFGRGHAGRGAALELTTWSDDIVLLTQGPAGLSAADLRMLERHSVAVIEDPIARLEGDPDGGGLARICLSSGRRLARRAIFHAFEQSRQSPLVEQLGCELNREGAVATGHCETTNIPGLFVAGDASRRVQFAIVAAAEGAMAAFAINTELLHEDLHRAGHQVEFTE